MVWNALVGSRKLSNGSFTEARSGRSSTASIFRLLLFSLSTVIINKCRVMNWHRLLLLGYFRQSSLVGFFLLVERARELAQYLEIHVLSIIIISLFLLESLPIASLSYGGWISLSSPTLLMTLVNLQIQCFILRKTGVNLQDGHCFLTDIDYCHFQGCWFSISTEAFLILNMILAP